jgi:hypothetical protein
MKLTRSLGMTALPFSVVAQIDNELAQSSRPIRLFDFRSNLLAELFDRSSQPFDKLLLTIDDLEDGSAMLKVIS